MKQPRRIAVIGGGISGLSAAHRLIELDPALEVRLFEASDRLGGVIFTEHRDDLLIEHSADMFTTREPWALELCGRLGIQDELIGTNQQNRGACVVRRGRLRPVPQGFLLMRPSRIGPVLTTPILSMRGKARLAWEYFVPAKKDAADESLAEFATRRLGREAYERLVQPLIGGIYTADPEKLSMQATMKQFVEMEQEHGGLIRGALREKKDSHEKEESSGARYGMFVAPREGMKQLIDSLASRLPSESVYLNSPVRELTQTEKHAWVLHLESESAPQTFDAVVVATPAPRAAEILKNIDEEIHRELNAIQYAGVAIVVAVYQRDQIKRPVSAFGYVTPIIERRNVLACSFASNKFAGRAQDEQLIIRAFVGGACQPELLELPDDDVKELVQKELEELIGVVGKPVMSKVVRWTHSMPQYHVGHLDRVERIEKLAADIPNLELAGNAYRGVGIPFCVRSGEQAAERLLSPS